MSAYFQASISFPFGFWLSFSCHHLCVFWRLQSDLPSLWRGVCSGSGRPITAVTFMERANRGKKKTTRECGREDSDAEGKECCHPLACGSPTGTRWLAGLVLAAAKARSSVKHWACDAWELTSEPGVLGEQADQNQLGPRTLAKKP